MPIFNEEIMETNINGKTIHEIDVQEDYVHILFTDGSVLEVHLYDAPAELTTSYTTAKELGYCHHEYLGLPIPSKA